MVHPVVPVLYVRVGFFNFTNLQPSSMTQTIRAHFYPFLNEKFDRSQKKITLRKKNIYKF